MTEDATGSLGETTGEAAPVIVRRGGRAAQRLTPRPPAVAAEGVIVGRGLLERRSDRKPQTARQRKVAGELPEWEPLPPGELVVRRG
jgi:hypothetical protein